MIYEKIGISHCPFGMYMDTKCTRMSIEIDTFIGSWTYMDEHAFQNDMRIRTVEKRENNSPKLKEEKNS